MQEGDRDIRFLVLDVDGVLTDGGMYYSGSGEHMKKFNTKDGIAILRLLSNGIPVAMLSSGRGNSKEIVEARAKVLGIEKVYCGAGPKIETMKDWCEELQIEMSQAAYIGDDINDTEVIQSVGLSACPADAVDKIKDMVDVVLKRKGGDACVREFVDDHLSNVLK